MQINDIQNLLKEVNYPGFSRDIVSFGMVDDVPEDWHEFLSLTNHN